jgi:hypothetical protein
MLKELLLWHLYETIQKVYERWLVKYGLQVE